MAKALADNLGNVVGSTNNVDVGAGLRSEAFQWIVNMVGSRSKRQVDELYEELGIFPVTDCGPAILYWPLRVQASIVYYDPRSLLMPSVRNDVALWSGRAS
jgi:hypothetical protein